MFFGKFLLEKLKINIMKFFNFLMKFFKFSYEVTIKDEFLVENLIFFLS